MKIRTFDLPRLSSGGCQCSNESLPISVSPSIAMVSLSSSPRSSLFINQSCRLSIPRMALSAFLCYAPHVLHHVFLQAPTHAFLSLVWILLLTPIAQSIPHHAVLLLVGSLDSMTSQYMHPTFALVDVTSPRLSWRDMHPRCLSVLTSQQEAIAPEHCPNR